MPVDMLLFLYLGPFLAQGFQGPWCGTSGTKTFSCAGSDFINTAVIYHDTTRVQRIDCTCKASGIKTSVGTSGSGAGTSTVNIGIGIYGGAGGSLDMSCTSNTVQRFDNYGSAASPPVTVSSASYPATQWNGVTWSVDGSGYISGLKLQVIDPPPTKSPTIKPTTSRPTTRAPTISPTLMPTFAPTTASPTLSPVISPTTSPVTLFPTRVPTVNPTVAPSPAPSIHPSLAPSTAPTTTVTQAPSTAPTAVTASPTPSAVQWNVDYPAVFTVRDTVYFTIEHDSNDDGNSLPEWVFSNGVIISGSWVLPLSPSSILLQYNFTAGQTYSFYAQQRYITPPHTQQRSTSATFTISALPLTVIVSGGNRDVLPNGVVYLNATQSYDPDVVQPQDTATAITLSNKLHPTLPFNLNSAIPPPLSFSWRIGGSSSCQIKTGSANDNDVLQIQTSSVSQISLCTIMVNVSTATKWTETTVTLRVVPSQYLLSSCVIDLTGPDSISASDSATLRLLATISQCSLTKITHFTWTSTPPVKSPCLSSVTASTSSDNRALSLNALQCLQSGVEYAFQFTAGDGTRNTSAWHTVLVSGIPTGGKCVSNAVAVTALSTVITINCNYTTLPSSSSSSSSSSSTDSQATSLTYAVQLRMGSDDSDTIFLTSPQYQSTITTILPLPLTSFFSGKVAVAVYVYSGDDNTVIDKSIPLITVTNANTNVCPFPLPSSSLNLENLYISFLQINYLMEQQYSSTSSTSSKNVNTSNCNAHDLNAAWNLLFSNFQSYLTQLELEELSYIDPTLDISSSSPSSSYPVNNQARTEYLVQVFETLLKALTLGENPHFGWFNSSSSSSSSLQTALVTSFTSLVSYGDLSSQAASQLISIASDLIYPLLTGNCTAQDRVTAMIAQASRSTTVGGLPSDPLWSWRSSYSSSNVAGSSSTGVTALSQSLFGDSAATLPMLNSATPMTTSTTDSYLNVPSSLAGLGGQISSLTVVNYASQTRDPSCRTSSTTSSNNKNEMLLASPNLVDITLSTRNGAIVAVNSIQNNLFSFTLPISDTERCGNLACGWWDSSGSTPITSSNANASNPAGSSSVSSGVWQTSGCTGEYYTPADGSPTTFICTCSHLTEFSLLLSPSVCTSLETGYLVMGALYGVVAIITLSKLLMRCHTQHTCKIMGTPVMTQHGLLLLLGIARTIACIALGIPKVSDSWTLGGRAAATVTPYLLMFWNYTYLVFNWAAILHFGMKYKDKAFDKVKWLFIACNVVVMAAIITLLCALAQPQPTTSSPRSSASNTANPVSQQAYDLMVGATLTLAIITLITALPFVMYSIGLTRAMRAGTSTAKSTHTQTRTTTENSMDDVNTERSMSVRVQRNYPNCIQLISRAITLRVKILTGGSLICVLLCVQAAMHVVGVTANRAPGRVGPTRSGAVSADASEMVVLVADWLAIITMLVLYHKAMHDRHEPNNGKTTRQLDHK